MDRVSLKRLVKLLLVLTIFISLYGIKQYLLPSALDYRLIELSTASPVTYLMGGHIRSFSTLSGPFHLGIYLISILLLLLSILQNQSKKTNYIPISIIFLFSLLALVMTVTKSNWFGLVSGIIFLTFLNTKNIIKLLIQYLAILIIGIIIVLLLLNLSSSIPLFKTVSSGLQAFINPLEAPTMTFRFDLWREKIIPLIIQSPWFGYGTGSASEGLGFYFYSSNSIYVHAHNQIFKVLIEGGFVGFFLFSIFISLSVFYTFRSRRFLNTRFTKIISDWTLSFFVALLVAGLVGPVWDTYPTNLLFWILFGSATHLQYFENNNSEQFHK